LAILYPFFVVEVCFHVMAVAAGSHTTTECLYILGDAVFSALFFNLVVLVEPLSSLAADNGEAFINLAIKRTASMSRSCLPFPFPFTAAVKRIFFLKAESGRD